LRVANFALARSSPHGGDQSPARAEPAPAQARDVEKDDRDLCRAFCRSRWPHPGDVRDRLVVGLGAPREPAKTARTGFGAPATGPCARDDRDPATAHRRRKSVISQPLILALAIAGSVTTASSNATPTARRRAASGSRASGSGAPMPAFCLPTPPPLPP